MPPTLITDTDLREDPPPPHQPCIEVILVLVSENPLYASKVRRMIDTLIRFERGSLVDEFHELHLGFMTEHEFEGYSPTEVVYYVNLDHDVESEKCQLSLSLEGRTLDGKRRPLGDNQNSLLRHFLIAFDSLYRDVLELVRTEVIVCGY